MIVQHKTGQDDNNVIKFDGRVLMAL